MGIFDLFAPRDEREKARLEKLARKLTEKYGPSENRQKVIDQLGAMGTPGALRTLCLRFTVRVDQSITDDEEKETVRRLLVGAGQAAVEPLREFVRAQDEGLAWGLRVLAEILPADRVLEVVVGELARLSREYTRDPEKKLVLLTWVREHGGGASVPRMEEALIGLLEDFSDDVRIGATRALAGTRPGERTRDALIELLLRDRDNARVRGEVLGALADLGADVKGHRPAVESLLVEPFFLDREGRVKRRG
ncbi:MAG TPA: HEAT repeat domain-containing protein [Anaeromyxobacteraceae bacterium]|nr:HEAT repeat domain-containing protein [Anaeromyxobacteraceae bacterium]